MKVGEYIRTKKGSIAKVLGIDYYIEGNGGELSNIDSIYFDNVVDDIDKDIYSGVFQDCLKEYKSSPNIIDLIEIGDYVNGKKVIDKWEEPDWYGYFIKLDGEETVPTIRKIESIVTKEQFDEMKYEIK